MQKLPVFGKNLPYNIPTGTFSRLKHYLSVTMKWLLQQPGPENTKKCHQPSSFPEILKALGMHMLTAAFLPSALSQKGAWFLAAFARLRFDSTKDRPCPLLFCAGYSTLKAKSHSKVRMKKKLCSKSGVRTDSAASRRVAIEKRK